MSRENGGFSPCVYSHPSVRCFSLATRDGRKSFNFVSLDLRERRMTDRAKTPWNSLEVVKLAIGLSTPLLLFWIGYATNEYLRASEESRRQLEAQRQAADTRRTAIQALSRFIYEQRVRAELLASELRWNAEKPVPASLDELVRRKQ